MVCMYSQSNRSERDGLDPYTDGPDGENSHRLNLLLSYTGWREQNWANQLPRLLQPMGVRAIRVETGRQATEVIGSQAVHIAVVDLGLPLDDAPSEGASGPHGVNQGGLQLLQLLRRLADPPPTVVIRQPSTTSRAKLRIMHQVLRDGAFAVLDTPVELELLLEVMRRILKRHYADVWPNGPVGEG